MTGARPDWPTGSITFLLTDVVGSTRLWELAPDDMDGALRRHDELVERIVSDAGGVLIKSRGEGDSSFSVFERVDGAAVAALELRAALRDEPWPERTPISVRMSVHCGEAIERDGDYYGTTVNRAARLRSVAGAGQIIVSRDAATELEGRLPEGAWLIELGEHPLRGLAGPEAVHTLVGAGETPGGIEVGRAGDVSDELPPALAAVGGVLVGRDRERAAIAEACASNEPAIVLVEGEPGIGKTALVAAAARDAWGDGATILYGRCERGGLPYQPFAEALDRWVATAPSGVLGEHVARFGAAAARLLPSLVARMGNAVPAWDSVPEPAALFGAVADLVASASRPHGGVLVIDDLHWADDASVQLLRHIVRSRLTAATLPILTFRTQEVDRTDPFGVLLEDLRRDPGLVRVALDGLDERRTVELLNRALGGHLDDGGQLLSERLRSEADGNPFFLLELLRHLVETGDLAEEGGEWRLLRPLEDLTAPAGVRELILARVDGLGGGATDALATASVVGSDFELDVLARSTGMDEEGLLDLLERGEAAGLVRESPVAGVFTFAHALIGHALYESSGGERRRRRHRAVAEALVDIWGHRPGDRTGEIAAHWVAGAGRDDGDTALDWVELAARHALVSLAPQQAMAWVAEATGLLSSSGPDEGRTCRLGVLQGRAQRMAGDAGYRETLLRAAHDAQRLGDADSLVEAALANTRGILASSGQVDEERVEVLEAALTTVGTADSADRARVLGLLATELDDHPDWRRTEQLGLEGRQMAKRVGEPAVILHSLMHSGLGWRPHTLHERMTSILPTAIELADELGDPYAGFFASAAGFGTALQAVAPKLAVEHLERMTTLAERYPEPTLRWFALVLEGALALFHGEVERAEDLANEAFALGMGCGQPDAPLWYGGQLGAVRIQQGRADELVPILRALGADDLTNGSVSCTLAYCLVELGEHDEAAGLLAAIHGGDYAGIPYSGGWLQAFGLAAHVAAEVGDLAAAQAIALRLAPFDEQLIMAATSVSGPVVAPLAHLALLQGDLDEADRLFERTHDITTRMQAPYFIATTDERWAGVARQRNDRDAQRRRLEEALMLAERHGYQAVAARCTTDLEAVG